MIRRSLLALIHIVSHTFFRRIDVRGAENIPPHGPVIFAGNHPNALMDGFLLVATCGRWPLHFMANAKLWKYRLLAPFLDATGAVPVQRREESDKPVDNQKTFDKLYELIEAGYSVGIFPEGISHAESQMVTLKTGTARVALEAGARGAAGLAIVPCGLNYIHRHRFRSQVLIEFGKPVRIDETWLRDYKSDNQVTVRKLTDQLAAALGRVTLNAPDWRTLRFVQASRRLYKPASATLGPDEYIELSRRFIDGYLQASADPRLREFRDDVEDYQARLDMLGLRDHQLRQPLTFARAFRKLVPRILSMLVLLPLALPGALLHLPVGWLAATVGEKFSYELDDVATLKVFATLLLLPLLYVAIAVLIWMHFGLWWSLAAVLGLTFSFFASVRLLEAQAGLLFSVLAILKMMRLGDELAELRKSRASLVTRVRNLADQYADPDKERLFSDDDFSR